MSECQKCGYEPHPYDGWNGQFWPYLILFLTGLLLGSFNSCNFSADIDLSSEPKGLEKKKIELLKANGQEMTSVSAEGDTTITYMYDTPQLEELIKEFGDIAAEDLFNHIDSVVTFSPDSGRAYISEKDLIIQ